MKNCSSCNRLNRRQLLQGAAGFGAMAALARLGEAQVTADGVTLQNSATACIFINLNGAPSHVDTFDLKQGFWTPADYNVTQSFRVAISQKLFPKLSTMIGDLCFVRSLRSWEAAHPRGQFYVQTGHSSNPAFDVETPHIGAVVSYALGVAGKFPPFLSLNGAPTQGAQFLGGQVDPVSPNADPRGFATLTHSYYDPPIEQARFELEYQMLLDMDATRNNPYDPQLAAYAQYYQAAKNMMYDPSIGNVFTLTNDDLARFGNTEFGRSCAIARNAVLAENGVRFINISQFGWDTHQSMLIRGYQPNLYSLANELDQGVGTLIQDLKANGALGRTLIVMMGEFGRTPGPLNSQGGRDHHPDAMSAVLAGGGVAGGRVIGATDATGNLIADFGWSQQRAIYMEDITATIYSALGIDWTTMISDTPSGRAFQYVARSSLYTHTAVTEVFG